MRHLIIAVLLVLSASVAARQPVVPAAVRAAAERITTKQIEADLAFLASDGLEGRNTPSGGFDLGAAYIEKRLERAGVKPLGDGGSYRQHYLVRETSLDAEAASVRVGESTYRLGEGFTVRALAGEFRGGSLRAVYVGHGWTADGIDPYRGLDVAGKAIVVHAESARPAGASIRQIGRVAVGGTSPMVEAARRGAAFVIYLAAGDLPPTPPGDRRREVVRRELEPPVPSAYAAPAVTAIRLGRAATQALLQGTPLDAATLDERLKNKDYPASFEFPVRIGVELPATSTTVRPFNVVALVEGTDGRLKNEYVVVQSHLDGAVGSRTVDGDGIYNSADDNASGSAAAISIAEQMMTVRPRRSVIFLWDSGEERGLWGTRRFVSAPPVPLSSLVALVNIDMIGANRAPGSADAAEERVTGPNEVFLVGPGALSKRVDALIEAVNGDFLKLVLNRKYDTADSEFFYPRTDAGPFLERGVLTIGFTTGLHERYHLPADEARFLDTPKMTSIARTVFAVVHALAEMNDRPAIEGPLPASVLRVVARNSLIWPQGAEQARQICRAHAGRRHRVVDIHM